MTRGGPLVLAALLAATAVVAIAVAPERPPQAGEETTLWLAAASLARDRDLAFGDSDAERFRATFGSAPEDVWKTVEGRLQAPGIPALAGAAGALVSPRRGPFAAQAALLALAALALWRLLAPPLGASSAALWTAALLFASAAFHAGVRLVPEAVGLAGIAVAYALVWGGRLLPTRAPGDVFRGELPGEARTFRWLGVGVGLGCAATLSPAYLFLALPPVAALPRPRRAAAATLALAGFAAAFLAAAAVEGAPWEPLDPVLDGRLAGWNAVFFLAGRHVGVLPYFLPIVLAFLAPAAGEGRRWILPAAAGSVLFALVFAPFDFAGASPGWGNPRFLPVLAALAALCGPAARFAPVVVAALAAPFLLPLWLSPVAGTPARLPESARALVEGARRWLPFETTLRDLPDSVEVRSGGVVLRTAGPALFAARDGALRLAARRGEIFVVSDRNLSSVRLGFGADAPAAIGVRGGELGNTVFRPSGDLAIDVGLKGPARRHPVWWSRAPASIYPLALELAKAPPAPLAVELVLARTAVPAPAAEPAP